MWQLFQWGLFTEPLQLRNKNRNKLDNKLSNPLLDYRAPCAQGQAGPPWTTRMTLRAAGGSC